MECYIFRKLVLVTEEVAVCQEVVYFTGRKQICEGYIWPVLRDSCLFNE